MATFVVSYPGLTPARAGKISAEAIISAHWDHSRSRGKTLHGQRPCSSLSSFGDNFALRHLEYYQMEKSAP